MKWIVAAVGLASPILCSAGRPVIHDLSLPDLIRASEIIAVVERATEVIVKGAHGCESQEWRLSILSIIKGSPSAEMKPGDTVNVRRNVTYYRDCMFREGGRTTGVSFSASQYKPSVSDAPAQERFIVFLQPTEGGLQLAADAGFESFGKTQEVARLVGQQVAEQSAPSDRRENAPAAEH